MTDILAKNGNMSAFIESIIKTTLDEMLQHQENGEYVQAEKCRMKFQQSKKDLQNYRLDEMNTRHKAEKKQMDSAHNQQMKNMSVFWENKLNQYSVQGRRLIQELENKHELDAHKTRQSMEGQLSLKVKESSQLLNLRKMQQHMAKQKNYVEAHRVQQKANKLYSEERNVWMKQRQLKIQAALTNLRNKQQAEMNNLRQRIKTGQEQQRKDWHLQKIRIVQKYENLSKQLKAQQERQVLSLKGQFKSKGGSSSPSIKSKISMSSTSSSK